MSWLSEALRYQLAKGITLVKWRFWGVKAMKPELQDVILIEREWFTPKSTIGQLSFDGEPICFTLEDTCRRTKQAGVTAIPSGRYEVVIDFSERFKQMMPHILDVPHFEGVRIHSGNTPENTEGCVLVGFRKDTDAIYDSKKAYERVMAELEKRLAKGRVFVSIVGGISKDQFEA